MGAEASVRAMVMIAGTMGVGAAVQVSKEPSSSCRFREK
jgi:hypothetical protein